MPIHLLARICTATVLGCALANAGVSTPIADVIPALSRLGAGWESKIQVLVDSTTTPFQVLADGDFSEATVSGWRRSAADPSEPLSGWGRARFHFRAPAETNRYYLQVDRFRSQTALSNRWARLAGSGFARRKIYPQDIGETAFVEREKGAATLWFRRGSFIVSVSSVGATPPEDPGGSMRRLAKVVDDNISGAIGTPGLIILQRKSKGEPLRTAGCVPGSPAESAGIRADGFLIAVDGTNVVNMAFRDVLDRVRGAIGSVVMLDLSDSIMAHTNRFTVKRGKLVHSKDTLQVIKD